MQVWLLVGAVVAVGLGLAWRIRTESDYRPPPARPRLVLVRDTSAAMRRMSAEMQRLTPGTTAAMRQMSAEMKRLSQTLDRTQPWLSQQRLKPLSRRSSDIE